MENKEEKKWQLDLCKNCNQMTNHREKLCLKCGLSTSKPDSKNWEQNFIHWHDTHHDETGYYPINKDYISYFKSLLHQVEEEAREEERERLLNQKANHHDQEVRQSAYREIIEMIPREIKGNIGGRGVGFNECREEFLSLLKSKLTKLQ